MVQLRIAALTAIGLFCIVPQASFGQTTTQTTNCTAWGNQVNCQSYAQTQQDFWTSFQQGMATGAYIRAQRSIANAAQARAANEEHDRMAAASSAQLTTFQMHLESMRADHAEPLAPALPRVNEATGLDFARTDGLEIRTRGPLNPGARYDITRRFAMTQSLDGQAIAEASISGTYGISQNFGTKPVVAVEGTSRLVIGPFNSFVFVSHESALVPELADRFRAQIVLGEDAIVSTPNTSGRFPVPNGAIPGILLRQALISLPDSLPATLRLWVIDEATTRAVEARFQRGADTKKRVPVATQGKSCEEKTPSVRERAMDVAQYTVLIGADRVDFYVLKSAPHLAWRNDETLVCVSSSNVRIGE